MQHYNNDLLNYIAAKYGLDAAIDIQETFGGEEFYITKRKPKDEKQAYIEKHFGEKSVRELARETGLSMRHIHRSINKPISRTQQNLFG